MKADALIESIVLPELRMLHAVDPAAAARKARRMVTTTGDFVRGSLPLIVPWLATEIGPDGPWSWSIGDAHQGNFSTLAVGRMDGEGIVPVTFGVSDVDDEAPSPWSWDLVRLLSSIAVICPELKRAAFEELSAVVLASYGECMARFGDGDALTARIDANGLPEVVKTLIGNASGEAKHKRFIGTMAIGAGQGARLRRGTDVADDPDAAATLRAAWDRRIGLPEHQVLDLARRLRPGGLSSLGRRRWWLLVRELEPVARLRLLEIKERAPSALTRVLPASPFTPWGAAQPVVSTMGSDPWQRVLHASAGEYLVRTRCHTRETIDHDLLDAGDWRRLGHLYGQLIATFHWRGLTQLAPDADKRCAAIASATGRWEGRLAKRSQRLGEHLVDLAAAYRKRVKPLITTIDRSEALDLG